MAVVLKRMTAEHDAIKISAVSMSRRREYHPKTPMVTWFAFVVLFTRAKL